MDPSTWLCAAMSVGGAAEAFKVLSTIHCGKVVTVRVLHKESGAVWSFECVVERKGA